MEGEGGGVGGDVRRGGRGCKEGCGGQRGGGGEEGCVGRGGETW